MSAFDEDILTGSNFGLSRRLGSIAKDTCYFPCRRAAFMLRVAFSLSFGGPLTSLRILLANVNSYRSWQISRFKSRLRMRRVVSYGAIIHVISQLIIAQFTLITLGLV